MDASALVYDIAVYSSLSAVWCMSFCGFVFKVYIDPFCSSYRQVWLNCCTRLSPVLCRGKRKYFVPSLPTCFLWYLLWQSSRGQSLVSS